MPPAEEPSTPRKPRPKKAPDETLAHFSLEAREAVYQMWMRERGAVNYGRLVKSFAPCWRHDLWNTTDETALETLEWALAMSSNRYGLQPEWIAADWARWRKITQADPWVRYDALMRAQGPVR